jgi:signal transduction histidine kinase
MENFLSKAFQEREEKQSRLDRLSFSLLLVLTTVPLLMSISYEKMRILERLTASAFEISEAKIVSGDLLGISSALQVGLRSQMQMSDCDCEIAVSVDGRLISHIGERLNHLAVSRHELKKSADGADIEVVSRVSFLPVVVFGSLLFAMAAGLYFLFQIRKRKLEADSLSLIQKLSQLEKDAAVQSAIARMTQVLSHDIRKPFSMVKSVLDVLKGVEDPQEMRELLIVVVPEVNQAIAAAEGLVQDVMQADGEIRLVKESKDPRELFERSLKDLRLVYPQAQIEVEMDYRHKDRVNVDEVRVQRVFANILGNALQAMGGSGKLRLETVQNESTVEFKITNYGSCIPAENIPKLFESFFTSGKKGGTGLGLAIAKRIVEAHGGKIQCRSEKNANHPSGFVEFSFDFPCSR